MPNSALRNRKKAAPQPFASLLLLGERAGVGVAANAHSAAASMAASDFVLSCC